MPAEFEKCRRNGGRIRTIKPNASTYLPICYPKGGGPGIRGEVHHNKKSPDSRSANRRLHGA